MMVWPKGKKLSSKQIAKLSLALKKFYSNPSERKRLRLANLKRYKDNPELRKKMSLLKLKQYRERPGLRKKISLGGIKRWKNPALRKKIDKVITRWWKDHPSARKQKAQEVKQFYINNPKAFKEFLRHGKNPLKKHIKTKAGFLVRSKGEKQIADFLYKKKIRFSYEKIDLLIKKKPFAGNICTPDFFIPKSNIFIEFYGGYPKSWKKKVLKNKIYRSHKIPVLALTPAELQDLDYYLIKQGKELADSEVAKGFKVSRQY